MSNLPHWYAAMETRIRTSEQKPTGDKFIEHLRSECRKVRGEE